MTSNLTSNEHSEPPMPTVPLSDAATWGGYYYQLAKHRHGEIERLRAAMREIKDLPEAGYDSSNARIMRRIADKSLSGDSSVPETTDYRAAYNRLATAARAVTAELQKVGDETNWRDGDQTDRVYAWYEMLLLVEALNADIQQPSAGETPAQSERKWRGIVAHDPKECGPCHVELQGIERAQKASAPVGDFLRRLDDDKQAQADVDAENGKGDEA